jgi:glycosyltransferase involved in cell wall biosynthesis
MVGDGPLLKTCQELARKLTIDNQVQFAGVHTRRSVAKLLRLSRAFVQHSVTAGNGDTEGLPLAILEAGAAGLPVISTRHAGIPDAVIEGENGLLVDEGDVQKMSEAMFQLAINPKLAGWMGKNYHQRVVDHFSRERSIQGLRAILRNATDTRQKSTSTRSQLRSEVSEPATTKNILETPNTLRYCPICQQTAQSFADFG